MLTRYAKILAYQRGGGDAAETYYDLGIDDIYLLPEPRRACLTLLWLRIAVVRRAAFYDVCDIYSAAVKIDHLQHIVEQPPGTADKRNTQKILLLARAFADEHDVCIGITVAENELCSRFAERTGLAAETFGV